MTLEYVTTEGAPGRNAGALWRDRERLIYAVVLRPNRWLDARMFTAAIALACGFLTLPLIPLLGSPALWVMLPFLASAPALLWYFLRRSTADGQVCERLDLSERRICVAHARGHGPVLFWEANPYVTRLKLHGANGPVENYITLTDGGREIELGAFLSPTERAVLHDELAAALAALSGPV